MAKIASAALVLGLAVAAAGPVAAQSSADDGLRAPGTRFRCQDGGELIAHFETSKARFVAVVDALDGYGPHALPSRPWTGGPVVPTWTDGQRTMTWSPGVQIMWMDGGVHRMCGRAGHSH